MDFFFFCEIFYYIEIDFTIAVLRLSHCKKFYMNSFFLKNYKPVHESNFFKFTAQFTKT